MYWCGEHTVQAAHSKPSVVSWHTPDRQVSGSGHTRLVHVVHWKLFPATTEHEPDRQLTP